MVVLQDILLFLRFSYLCFWLVAFLNGLLLVFIDLAEHAKAVVLLCFDFECVEEGTSMLKL